MTNGEKIMAIMKPRKDQIRFYGNWVEIEIQKLGINFSCELDWWNTEYNEPSNKSIIYKVKELKEIQEDLDKLRKLNEPTTKNDLEVNYSLDDFIKYCKRTFGVELTVKKSDNPDTYAKLFKTTKNDCAEQNGCISCSLDDGDDCCRKLYEESMQNLTTKNDLGVDCISRQAVDNLVWEYLRKATDENIAFYEHFLDLPSVTPQEPKPKWIPVAERLPNNSGRYLVNYGSGYVGIAHYYESVSKWGCTTTERVVKWMPLPEGGE